MLESRLVTCVFEWVPRGKHFWHESVLFAIWSAALKTKWAYIKFYLPN